MVRRIWCEATLDPPLWVPARVANMITVSMPWSRHQLLAMLRKFILQTR